MKFGQLVLRKIIDIAATRCQILRLRLRPRHRWGSLQRSPEPLVEFKGAIPLREVRRGIVNYSIGVY